MGNSAICKPHPAVVVANPRVCATHNARTWRLALASLRSGGSVGAELNTSADGRHIEDIVRVVRESRPEVVIAAGGDGTVSDVVQAIMLSDVAERPALAIIPFGTANNVARSLGLISCRHGGEKAVDLAVATALNGAERQIDLGRVGLGGSAAPLHRILRFRHGRRYPRDA